MPADAYKEISMPLVTGGHLEGTRLELAEAYNLAAGDCSIADEISVPYALIGA